MTHLIRLRRCLRVFVVVALVAGIYLAGGMAQGWVVGLMRTLQDPLGRMVLYGGLFCYILLMALPFVPGLEISLLLMFLFGVEGIVAVYFGTWVALCGSYLAGHWLSLRTMAAALGWLHLTRGSEFLLSLEGKPPDEILRRVLARAPTRGVPWLVRYRYLTIACAFNLPGNAFIGGGGGIALAAGMSQVFRFPLYALTVALAIAPVPVTLLVLALLPGPAS